MESYTVQCVAVGDGTCETGALTSPAASPINPQWSASPSYQIPQDQAFLPHIVVKVTNSHGVTVERVFAMPGEHRPTFANPAPYAEMPVGAFSRVRLTEVIPSALLPNQDVSIFPYVEEIQDQLPEGIQMELVEEAGQWYLEAFGTTYGDQMGPHAITVPIEQLPLGSGWQGPPATVTLGSSRARSPATVRSCATRRWRSSIGPTGPGGPTGSSKSLTSPTPCRTSRSPGPWSASSRGSGRSSWSSRATKMRSSRSRNR